ncbi:hypothetical protein [Nodosilinea nodulosa]|uniref:hypothetical protein n=1 Tax=Nodosilinea nodulosa TaxID=416001 RepID=UPI0012D77198|nr:hypothetical protein [Nodosilinea nodulosa]
MSPEEAPSLVGLYGKYLLSKADGTPLDPRARYFVLRYDAHAEHGHQSRLALNAYAVQMQDIMPELSQQLLNQIVDEAEESYRLNHPDNSTPGDNHE